MTTAVEEKPRTGLIEQAGVPGQNEESRVTPAAVGCKGKNRLNEQRIAGERIAAIKKNVIEGIKHYFDPACMSPSQKIAVVLLQKVMCTTGISDLGYELYHKMEQDVYNNENMDEDPEGLDFWRGLILGIDFVSNLS